MLSPLARALPAMTALQATVALGMFALSVLAPQLGLSVAELAALNTLMFSVGTVGALFAGRLLARFGDWHVAAACAGAVALGMACLLAGFPHAAWIAVLLFGLAFGPETPASASVLSRVTPPARRPWIFSVRQTGNQIGAMSGSVLLPWLLTVAPAAPYLFVGAVGIAMAAWCVVLSRDDRLANLPQSVATAATTGAALARVLRSRGLRALAVATLAFTAVQMCLNTFLMSLAVREWHLGVAHAAACVALLQAAGLGGRLFWGWFAQRVASAARLLGCIGLAIAAAGLALVALPAPGLSAGTLALVALLGFCASGWNGVLVAEVSRIAGARQAGALTGAVLMFGYAGLTIAPLAFAAWSAAAAMAWAFAGMFALAGLAAALLLLTPAEPSSGND